ncbi:phd finger [Olea europaea subsp. europaea]|uniref:Phd finger n=2 Tax=Olea europaea subsp. europaea TaxID=158383 RepID=A0A8S0SWB7_OLEEU|nr:phd finger [Olea europaea subsp. europaea]
MDSTVEIESGRRLVGLGEKSLAEGDVVLSKVDPLGKKRLAEGDVGLSKEGPPAKRIKRGELIGNMKKVAETVLVLAAMGKMRGGRVPTEIEENLMADARGRLAKVCDGFAPKDVFPRDAFGGMIEDLGLNKLKEQRLEFRPPKISIAEKLMLSKRQMEKLEDFSASTPHTSRHAQMNSSAALDIRGKSHTARTSQLDKPSHVRMSSGSFQSASPLGHLIKANSTSSPYQLPSSEIRPMVSSALPANHLGPASLPRVDGPHPRLDGRSDGSSHPSQVEANYSANSSFRTPTCSVQSQPVSSAKSGMDDKAPINMSVKIEGSGAGVAAFRPIVNQTTNTLPSTQHVQGSNIQAPTVGKSHADICKIVQKVLHPSFSEHSTWNSPSIDYMNKALTCQMCMHTLTEVDSILVCDACEKGFHLRCLQTTNQKGVPRGEWHCGKCLLLSNGKPLPPKYGRVMRNINAPKMSSSAAAVPSSSYKKAAASDEVSQPKVMVNGNSSMQNVPPDSISVNNSHLLSRPSGPVTVNAKEMQGNDIDSNGANTDDQISSRTCQNNLMKPSGATCVSLTSSSGGKSCDSELVELKSNDPAKSETSLSIDLQAPGNAQDGTGVSFPSNEASLPKISFENHVMPMDSKCSHGIETSNCKSDQLNEQEVLQDNLAETLTAMAGNTEQGRSSPDGLHAVDWIGDAIQVSDEKTYYKSCCINGSVHELLDYVLILFDNDKLIPSKLQVMWEDKNTRMKWVSVNRCYFPGDLPESVGRPCGLESSEVYESTRLSEIMAGLIQSPCEVLPPRKFAEESERRARSRTQPNDHLEPLYLCKWIYDESKGLFRDISC